jgi:putative acetyltransferase
VIVRREQPPDVPVVREVVAAAFTRPDVPSEPPVEVWLLDRLRDDEAWLPALSLVAVDLPDGPVIGHVVCARADVDGVPVLGLGPLAVRPDKQRQGVGKALMHAVLGAAEALGEPLVALLGDPAYYGRYGFQASIRYGIASPDPGWGEYFQVRLLATGTPPAGTFRYATPFRAL